MRGHGQRWHRACWRLVSQHGAGHSVAAETSISHTGHCLRETSAAAAGSRQVASAAVAAASRMLSQTGAAATMAPGGMPTAVQPFVSGFAARVATELRAALSSSSAYHSAAAQAAAASRPAAARVGGACAGSATSGNRRQAAAGSRAAFSSGAPPAAAAAPQQASTAAPVLASNPGLLKRWTGFGRSSGSAGVPHFGYGRHVVQPIAFSLAVAGGAFAWALCRDEDRRAARDGLAPGHAEGGRAVDAVDVQDALEGRARHHWADSLPLLLRPAAHYWASFREPTRTLIALVAMNAAVAVAWRLPLLNRLMARNFTHTPGAGRSRTLLTSVFSHRGALHLTFNMLALWSFGHVAANELGREQFLAYYVSAGVLASLASHLTTVWPLLGDNIPAATLLHRVQAIRPSLGASGAVIALFALVAARQSDRQVALIFLPDYPFSIGTGFKGMVGFDTAGMLLGWRLFDHVAHLGGAGFGSWYARWGEGLVWPPGSAARWAALAARDEWRQLGVEPRKEE